MDARKFPRFPVQCPITFSGGHIAGKGTVMNLSKNGWKVVSNQGGSRRGMPGAAYVPACRKMSSSGRRNNNEIHHHSDLDHFVELVWI